MNTTMLFSSCFIGITRFLVVIVVTNALVVPQTPHRSRSVFQTSTRIRSSTISAIDSSTSTALQSSSNNDFVPLKKGSTVALVTPMNPDGSLDLPSLRTILRHHVASQTDGLCILGTTGEATTLTMEERRIVLELAVEEVKDKIPILVGCGTINPTSVKEQTLQAIDLGCDAALIVTPYYVKPPQRALIKHFTDVADLGMPVVCYNVPGRSGVDMSDETVRICSEHKNIVGIKDATGDLSRVSHLREICGDDFLMYSGDDGTSAQFVLDGGDGGISVTANIAPQRMHDMMKAAIAKDGDKVKELNDPLDVLHNRIFCESNPIPTKYALMKMGMMPSDMARPPLCQLDTEYHSFIEEALKSNGLL